MKQYSAEQLNSMSREDLIRALTDSQNANIDLTNRLLLTEEKLKKALKKIFGASSEHVAKEMESPAEQLSFFANEAEMWADERKEEKKTIVAAHARKSERRENLLDTLPENTEVEVVEHRPEDQTCPNCGADLVELGKEVRRTIVIIPAQVMIREDVFYNYKCNKCTTGDENTVIVEAPKEATVLPGSYASPEAIAYIMSQKFVMASPLYRIEQELKRQGVMLSRQTMSNWFLTSTTRWLEPLYDALKAELLKQDVLHADETELQVLHEPGKKPQTKSYMWLYRTSGCAEMPIVLYEYRASRSAQHPKKFLEGFTGYLHADGYAGYHALTNMTIVGCLAHARRKFYDAQKISADKTAESIATEAVRRLDEIFDLDRSYSNLLYEERYNKRLEEVYPRLQDLLTWLEGCNLAPKFALGTALKYLKDQWQYLINIFKDGRLELTNNRAERSIKPFVIGRKNWLFANTTDGAQSSAIVYSIIETAKENGLDPYRYLLYIFREAPKLAAEREDWVDEFLPSKAPEECKV